MASITEGYVGCWLNQVSMDAQMVTQQSSALEHFSTCSMSSKGASHCGHAACSYIFQVCINFPTPSMPTTRLVLDTRCPKERFRDAYPLAFQSTSSNVLGGSRLSQYFLARGFEKWVYSCSGRFLEVFASPSQSCHGSSVMLLPGGVTTSA
eukprot:scaffold19104_cov38-Attheya_sp.AAC.1